MAQFGWAYIDCGDASDAAEGSDWFGSDPSC